MAGDPNAGVGLAEVRRATFGCAAVLALVFGAIVWSAVSWRSGIEEPLETIAVQLPAGSIAVAADGPSRAKASFFWSGTPGVLVDTRRLYVVPGDVQSVKRHFEETLARHDLATLYSWAGSMQVGAGGATGHWGGGYEQLTLAGPITMDARIDIAYSSRATAFGAPRPDLEKAGALDSAGALKPGWGLLLVRVQGTGIRSAVFLDGGQSEPASRSLPNPAP